MSENCTYHVDLGHRVDEDDGEDGDGETEEEGAREVPDDATQAHGKQQHQDHLQDSGCGDSLQIGGDRNQKLCFQHEHMTSCWL